MYTKLTHRLAFATSQTFNQFLQTCMVDIKKNASQKKVNKNLKTRKEVTHTGIQLYHISTKTWEVFTYM